jgi:hypothetical protein
VSSYIRLDSGLKSLTEYADSQIEVEGQKVDLFPGSKAMISHLRINNLISNPSKKHIIIMGVATAIILSLAIILMTVASYQGFFADGYSSPSAMALAIASTPLIALSLVGSILFMLVAVPEYLTTKKKLEQAAQIMTPLDYALMMELAIENQINEIKNLEESNKEIETKLSSQNVDVRVQLEPDDQDKDMSYAGYQQALQIRQNNQNLKIETAGRENLQRKFEENTTKLKNAKAVLEQHEKDFETQKCKEILLTEKR